MSNKNIVDLYTKNARGSAAINILRDRIKMTIGMIDGNIEELAFQTLVLCCAQSYIVTSDKGDWIVDCDYARKSVIFTHGFGGRAFAIFILTFDGSQVSVSHVNKVSSEWICNLDAAMPSLVDFLMNASTWFAEAVRKNIAAANYADSIGLSAD